MVHHQTHCHLALKVGTLVNRGQNKTPLKVRNHFPNQVGGNHFDFVTQAAGSDRVAHRQAIRRADVQPSQMRMAAEEVIDFLKGFVFVIMSLDNLKGPALRREASEAFGKGLNFFSVVLCDCAAGDYRDDRLRTEQLSHQFSCKMTAHDRVNRDYCRAGRARSVGVHANHVGMALFRMIDQRRKILGVARDK